MIRCNEICSSWHATWVGPLDSLHFHVQEPYAHTCLNTDQPQLIARLYITVWPDTSADLGSGFLRFRRPYEGL